MPGRCVSGPPGATRHRRDHLRREPGEEGPGPRPRRVGARRRAGRGARRGGPATSAAGRAWLRARPTSDRGARTRRARGRACGSPGCSPRDEYRALLRRARVFLTAPRREDYGIAQLEALADGCRARHDARARAVRGARRSRARSTRGSSGRELAIRTALDDPRPDYAERARRGRAVLRPPPSTASSPSELLPRSSPARLRSGAKSAHERVLATCSGVSQARRAVAMPYWSRSKFSARVGVGVDQDHHARRGGGARVDLVHVAPVRGGVDLDHRAVRRGGRDHARSCRSRTAGGSRSCGRSGGRSRPATGARWPRSCARSSRPRPSRTRCGSSRSPSPGAPAARPGSPASRPGGCWTRCPASTVKPSRRSLSAAISSIRASSASGVTWLPKPCEAEWSVTARYSQPRALRRLDHLLERLAPVARASCGSAGRRAGRSSSISVGSVPFARRLELPAPLAQLRRDPRQPEPLVDLLLGRAARRLAGLVVEHAVLGDVQPAPDHRLAQLHVVGLGAGEVLQDVAELVGRDDLQVDLHARVRDHARARRRRSAGTDSTSSSAAERRDQRAGVGRRWR